MPDEFDMPIDGDFDQPVEAEPKPARARRAPAKKRTKKVQRRPRASEPVFEQPRRPRISIEAATHSPRRVNIYRRLSVGFLVATVAVVVVIGFFTFQRTTITVHQKPVPVAATFGIQVAESAAPGDKNVFVGKVLSVATSTVVYGTPTATSDKPGKSHGTVTITNNSGASQALVATTRFLSESGVLFRLINGVTVPAKSSITAEIAADKPGVTGDIGPSKFTIPGLNAAQQKLVYGTTTEPMIGGNSKVGVVSQADIDHAKEAARKALLDLGQKVFATLNVTPEYDVLYINPQVKIETSVKLGDTVDQFLVTASGSMSAVTYPKAAVFAAADREVQNKVPTPYHTVVFENNAPVVSLQTANASQKTAALQVYREGKAVLDKRAAAFQGAQFLGRTHDEIVDQLKTIQGVEAVDVSFFPFWMKNAPGSPERIQVNIEN